MQHDEQMPPPRSLPAHHLPQASLIFQSTLDLLNTAAQILNFQPLACPPSLSGSSRLADGSAPRALASLSSTSGSCSGSSDSDSDGQPEGWNSESPPWVSIAAGSADSGRDSSCLAAAAVRGEMTSLQEALTSGHLYSPCRAHRWRASACTGEVASLQMSCRDGRLQDCNTACGCCRALWAKLAVACTCKTLLLSEWMHAGGTA